MARQHAGVGCAVIRDGKAAVLTDDIDIEIDQALAAKSARCRAHAVRGMAG